MLAVFLAATSFAPGAPLRGAVVAPRRAAAPVAFDTLDFDTLHSVTTQIAELVDADGERVYGAVDAPGWVAPVGAVVIAFFTTLLPMCARPLRPPAQLLRPAHPPLTPPPPSTARWPRARRPSRACRRPRRAASDRVTVASRGAAAAAARVGGAHMLFEV